jgi:hypothetical protein
MSVLIGIADTYTRRLDAKGMDDKTGGALGDVVQVATEPAGRNRGERH